MKNFKKIGLISIIALAAASSVTTFATDKAMEKAIENNPENYKEITETITITEDIRQDADGKTKVNRTKTSEVKGKPKDKTDISFKKTDDNSIIPFNTKITETNEKDYTAKQFDKNAIKKLNENFNDDANNYDPSNPLTTEENKSNDINGTTTPVTVDDKNGNNPATQNTNPDTINATNNEPNNLKTQPNDKTTTMVNSSEQQNPPL